MKKRKEVLGNGNCKWHNLPYVRGFACATCEEALQATSDRLNAMFSNPKFQKSMDDLLSKEK